MDCKGQSTLKAGENNKEPRCITIYINPPSVNLAGALYYRTVGYKMAHLMRINTSAATEGV